MSHIVISSGRKSSSKRGSRQEEGFVDMDVEDSATIPNWVASQLVESQKLVKELVVEEPISFEERSLTIHNTHYDKIGRKL